MSNDLIPLSLTPKLATFTHSPVAVNQLSHCVPRTFKSGDLFSSIFSELSSTAISEISKQLTNSIVELKSPPSPSSLNFVQRENSVEETLFDATASVKILTAQVAMHMDRKMRDKLFTQIDSLHDLNEWNNDDKPVEASSFATFLKVFLEIKPDKHPGLGLTFDGHLIAAWTTGKDRLTTEFLPNSRVRWVLSRSFNGETERAAGETLASRLHQCLIPYSPEHWFSNARI